MALQHSGWEGALNNRTHCNVRLSSASSSSIGCCDIGRSNTANWGQSFMVDRSPALTTSSKYLWLLGNIPNIVGGRCGKLRRSERCMLAGVKPGNIQDLSNHAAMVALGNMMLVPVIGCVLVPIMEIIRKFENYVSPPSPSLPITPLGGPPSEGRLCWICSAPGCKVCCKCLAFSKSANNVMVQVKSTISHDFESLASPACGYGLYSGSCLLRCGGGRSHTIVTIRQRS